MRTSNREVLMRQRSSPSGSGSPAPNPRWQRSRQVLVSLALVLWAHHAHAAVVNLTSGSATLADEPSVSIVGDQRWVTWLEYGNDPEQVTIRAQRFNGTASVEGPFVVASGALVSPRVVAVDADQAWFVWIDLGQAGGRLVARQRIKGAWARAAPLELADKAAFPAVTLDGSGHPHVAWEGRSPTGVAIYTASWSGTAFTAAAEISKAGVSSYAPVLETDSEGAIWAVWQAYIGSNYEIMARRRVGGLWGPTWQVTERQDAGGSFLGMHTLPTVHKGANGLVWVGWVAKGLDVRAPSTPPHLSGWVVDRRLQLRRVWPDGTMDAIRQVPVPWDTLTHDSLEDKHRGPDRPVLLATRGRVMVFYRLLSNDKVKDPSRIHWRVLMQYTTPAADLWSAPFEVSGDGAVDTESYPHAPAVADTGSGFWVAFQQGFRPALYYGADEPDLDVLVSDVAEAALGPATLAGERLETYPAPLVFDQPRGPTGVQHLGDSYQLLFGDLHSHSVKSRDAHFRDDHLEENYRRARDLLALDFYVVTDHGFHASPYDWYQNRGACLQNVGGRGFTTLLGLEYTNHDYGHQNVIYDSCAGALQYRQATPSLPETMWAALPLGRALAIPHHPVDAHDTLDYDFRHFDPAFNRHYEIYQARGSFECYTCVGVFRDPWPSATQSWYYSKPADPSQGALYFQDALAAGHRLGVVASPDHTGFWGVTGVYAASSSQAHLFEALHARRTYGVSNAAARITMDFRADGRMMGSEYTLRDTCPVFYGRVQTSYRHPETDAPGVIDQIKLFRVTDHAPGEGGQILLLQPGKGDVSFTYYDANCPKTGSAAYYLRAVQSDVFGVDTPRRPSVAWTSPVFVSWTAGDPSRDAVIETIEAPATLTPASPAAITVNVRNSGDIPWTGLEGYRLAVDAGSLTVPAELPLPPAAHVLPGQSFAFHATLTAPPTSGQFSIKVQMQSPAGRFGEEQRVEIAVRVDVRDLGGATPDHDGGPTPADSGLAQQKERPPNGGCSLAPVEGLPEALGWLLVLVGLLIARRLDQPRG